MPLSHRNAATNAQRQAAWRQRHAQSHAQALAAKGLPPLPAIPSLPGTARWSAQHNLALATLQTMRDEMQDYFDNRTPIWQEGDRGQAMSSRIETIDAIVTTIEDLEIA